MLPVNDCPGCRFASIAKLAGEQLGPYIANLVPKLYRYQYDPNARVRDSMTHIWRALVAEPKKTVDEHFGAILQELLKVHPLLCISLALNDMFESEDCQYMPLSLLASVRCTLSTDAHVTLSTAMPYMPCTHICCTRFNHLRRLHVEKDMP